MASYRKDTASTATDSGLVTACCGHGVISTCLGGCIPVMLARQFHETGDPQTPSTSGGSHTIMVIREVRPRYKSTTYKNGQLLGAVSAPG
jgi:hypothetical protein